MRFGRGAGRRALGSTLVAAVVSVGGLVAAPPTSALAAGWSEPSAVTPASPPGAVNPAPDIVDVTTSGPTDLPAGGTYISKDTVWGPSGSPYIVHGILQVQGGATLTLLPGTVVKVDGGEKNLGRILALGGRILSLGTPEKRVVITSAKDDTVGGDSNGDGEASGAARGDWTSLTASNGPTDMVSVLEYTDVRYGGYGLSNMNSMVGGRIILAHCRLSESLQALVGSVLSLTNSELDRAARGLTLVSHRSYVPVVGNVFGAGLGEAVYLNSVRGVRFWYNTVSSSIFVTGVTDRENERSHADLRFNTFVGGLGILVFNQELHDYRYNAWRGDINAVRFPFCAPRESPEGPYYLRQVNGKCPGYYDAVGWLQTVLPGLSTPLSSEPPESVVAQSHPTFGPVDTRTGSLTWSARDLTVTDGPRTLDAARTFSSDRRSSGDIGDGWYTSYSQGLSSADGESLLSMPGGAEVPFPADPSGWQVRRPGVGATMRESGDAVRTADRRTFEFNAAGELTGVVEGDAAQRVVVNRSGGQVASVKGAFGRTLTYSREGGKLRKVSDSAGRSVVYTYDGEHLVSAAGPGTAVESYGYDAQGRLVKVMRGTDDDRVTVLDVGYDDQGRVGWVAQPTTGKVTIAYDPDNHRTRLTHPDGAVTVQEYDHRGRVVAQTRGQGTTRTVYDAESRAIATFVGVPTHTMEGYAPDTSMTLYDGSGDPVTVIDGVGNSVVTTFNDDHQPVKTVNPDGGVIMRSYDSDGRVVSVSDPGGGTWTYSYNAQGQVTSQVDPLGRTSSVTYASSGDPSSVTDAQGGVTAFETDSLGRRTSTTDAVGGVTTTAWTPDDAVAVLTRPGGGTVTTTYTSARLPVSVTTRLSATRSATSTTAYDNRGRAVSATDALGGVSKVAYDSSGRVAETTDQLGRVTKTAYSPEGWVSKVIDPRGGERSADYDPAGRLWRVTDALGSVTQMAHDPAGRVKVLSGPDGGSTRYAYDTMGRRTKVTTPLGMVWETAYDVLSRPVKVTDPDRRVSTSTYDKLGRLSKTVDRLGQERSVVYDGRTVTTSDAIGVLDTTTTDALNRVAKRVAADGGVSTWSYTPDGKVASETTPAGTTRYTYDLAGHPTSVTDARAHTTSYDLDLMGRVTTTTYPDTSTATTVYDAVGNVTKVTDRSGVSTTRDFDAGNNLVSQTDPTGARTSMEYDLLGRLTTKTDPTGVVAGTRYDPLGRVAVTYDTLGASTVTTYTKDGDVASVTSPVGVPTTYTYDKRGNRLTERVRNATTKSWTYDAEDRVLTATAPYPHTYTYDARERVLTDKDALGGVTTLAYAVTDSGSKVTRTSPTGAVTTTEVDQARRVSAVTDPRGARTSFSWTPTGELASARLPEGGVWEYGYNADGSMTSQKDPVGNVSTWTYEGDRLSSSMSAAHRRVDSTYDAAGRVASTTATRDGTNPEKFAYSYDKAGRLVAAEAVSGTRLTSLGFDYNSRGQLTAGTSAAGASRYGYDLAGRLAMSATGADGGAAPETTYLYTDTDRGQLSGIRGPVNLSVDINARGELTQLVPLNPTRGSYQRFGYDAAGHLVSVSGRSPATYTYDGDGRLVKEVSPVPGKKAPDGSPSKRTTAYGLDAAGNLTAEEVSVDGTKESRTEYAYDRDGNRVSAAVEGGATTTYEVNAADQVTRDSTGGSYTYDRDGLLTSSPSGSREYNSYGQLVRAVSSAGADANGQAASPEAVDYSRDALGRMSGRVNTSAPAGGVDAGQVWLSYAGLGESLEMAKGSPADANAVTQVLRDPTGRLLALAGVGGPARVLHLDRHLDVVAAEDAATGNQVGASTFDAFGVVSGSLLRASGASAGTGGAGAASSAGLSVPLGFQGGYTDAVTGRVDMTFRDYDPRLGRFTAMDSVVGDVGVAGSFNRYSYGFGSPLDVVDPTGHWPKWFDRSVNAVGDFFSDGVDAVVGVYDGLKETLSSVKQAVTSSFRAAVAWGSEKVSQGKAWLGEKASQAKAAVSEVAATVSQAWTSARAEGGALSNKNLAHAGVMVGSVVVGAAICGATAGVGCLLGGAVVNVGATYADAAIDGRSPSGVEIAAAMIPLPGGGGAAGRALGRETLSEVGEAGARRALGRAEVSVVRAEGVEQVETRAARATGADVVESSTARRAGLPEPTSAGSATRAVDSTTAANTGSALTRVGDFASRKATFEHYSKHVLGVQLGKKGKAVAKPGGADMPEFGSFAEYQGAARTFMGCGLPEGVLQRGRGTDILRVDPSTGYFGVRSSDGTIRTFFRPDGDPVAYFWNQ